MQKLTILNRLDQPLCEITCSEAEVASVVRKFSVRPDVLAIKWQGKRWSSAREMFDRMVAINRHSMSCGGTRVYDSI